MALTFFGKSENEREKDLANQIEELKKRTDELAKSNKALQDSADLQRQKAETAEAALTAKDEELRKAFGELQVLQKEIDDIKAATTAENEKNAAVVQLMADKDAKIASLEKAVADKDAEIATLKAAPAPEQKPQEDETSPRHYYIMRKRFPDEQKRYAENQPPHLSILSGSTSGTFFLPAR